jgi:hypothetical protein
VCIGAGPGRGSIGGNRRKNRRNVVLEVRPAFLPERDELRIERRVPVAAVKAAQRPHPRERRLEPLSTGETSNILVHRFVLRLGQGRHVHEISAISAVCATHSSRWSTLRDCLATARALLLLLVELSWSGWCGCDERQASEPQRRGQSYGHPHHDEVEAYSKGCPRRNDPTSAPNCVSYSSGTEKPWRESRLAPSLNPEKRTVCGKRRHLSMSFSSVWSGHMSPGARGTRGPTRAARRTASPAAGSARSSAPSPSASRSGSWSWPAGESRSRVGSFVEQASPTAEGENT